MLKITVPLLFQLFDRLHQVIELYNSADSFLPHRRVCGAAVNANSKTQGAGSRGTQRHSRWFQNHRGIGSITTQQRCQSSHSSRLFPDNTLNEYVSAGFQAKLLKRRHRRDSGCETAFHVARTAPPQPVVANVAAPRTTGPGAIVSGGNDIHVSVENQRSRIRVGATPLRNNNRPIAEGKAIVRK